MEEMTIEDAKKEIERLQKYIKSKPKAWPDTFEEMEEESLYWGLEIINNGNDRYMIAMNSPADGYPIKVNEYWTNREALKDYIKQNGTIDEHVYQFIKFDTAKELYLWMAEGEE